MAIVPVFARLSGRRSGGYAAIAAIGLLVGSARAAEPAAAQGDESAQLFNEGRQLRNKGRFQEACAKFRAALAVRQSPGTLLNVANCQEADGEVAGALESVEAALNLAAREPDPLKRETWILTAREEIASLEPRVATLTVRSTGAAAPAVMLDGKPLLRWDTGLRLNPGHHEVEAAAPRRKPFVRAPESALGSTATGVVFIAGSGQRRVRWRRRDGAGGQEDGLGSQE